MEKIYHNKKQNTGLLFELLARQVVSNTVSKDDIKAKKALYLIKKYFKKGTELYEELQIINALIYNEVSNTRIASKLISEALRAAAELDKNKLNDEKFHLISEINNNFDKKVFFESHVPSYKVYGAVYTLIDSIRNNIKYDITQKVKLEETLMEHLLDNEEIKRINESRQPTEYDNIDNFTFKVIIKRFNEKYDKVLTETQKNILREYLRCTSERKFDNFIEKTKNQIEKSLYENMKTVKDKGILAKIYQAMLSFGKINESETKESKTEMLMSYAQLVDELKKMKDETIEK